MTEEEKNRTKLAWAYAYGRHAQYHHGGEFISSVEFAEEVVKRGTRLPDFDALWLELSERVRARREAEARWEEAKRDIPRHDEQVEADYGQVA